MLKIRNASSNPENLFKEISSLEFSRNVELSVNNIHRSEQEEEEPEDKERTIRRRRRFSGYSNRMVRTQLVVSVVLVSTLLLLNTEAKTVDPYKVTSRFFCSLQ